MNDLNAHEVRVLGSLVEKELTTPDQYPLSLNAILLACNQKSNREPVMAFSESEVMETLDALTARHLVREKNLSGTRVSKFVHRLSGGLGLTFDFDRNELGTLCVLMLRGPQTPGEIRARTARLCTFSSLDEVEKTLERLAENERGPYVMRLARQPGRKESRYAHLMSGEPSLPAYAPEPNAQPSLSGTADPGVHERIAALESRVDALERERALERRGTGGDDQS